LVEQKLDLVHF